MGRFINITSEFNTNISRSKFALDTNVLYWMFYGNSIYSKKYQSKYPDVVIKLKSRSNNLFVSTVNICELFNLIERNEYELYKSIHQKDDEFTLKQYRKIEDERKKVQKALGLIYKQIKSFVTIIDQSVSQNILTRFYSEYNLHKLDLYDYSLLDFCEVNKISNIITDDSDFIKADKFDIFTANESFFKKDNT